MLHNVRCLCAPRMYAQPHCTALRDVSASVLFARQGVGEGGTGGSDWRKEGAGKVVYNGESTSGWSQSLVLMRKERRRRRGGRDFWTLSTDGRG